MQEANPDVVIWPGREIITYFGHANALGETPSVLDYRHGLRGARRWRDIQAATLADGALFQVNHPDFFPPPLSPFCRGCYFELGEVVDWSRVDTIEVVTGPVLASTADLGLPGTPVFLQNPFVQAAIDRWEGLLRRASTSPRCRARTRRASSPSPSGAATARRPPRCTPTELVPAGAHRGGPRRARLRADARRRRAARRSS